MDPGTYDVSVWPTTGDIPGSQGRKREFGCGGEDNTDLSGHPQSFVYQQRPDEDCDPQLLSLNHILDNLLRPDWQGVNTDFSTIPHLHPNAHIALDCTTMGELRKGGQWHIYTDGACRRGRAAWAFVILQQDWQYGKEVYQTVGFAAGTLNEQLASCEANALNAEATAIIAMAEYLLAQEGLAEAHIQCHFDALSVGQGAFGVSNCCTLQGAVEERQQAARLLVSLVQRTAMKIEGKHVHAHEGHPWNEMVDSIAGAVAEWMASTHQGMFEKSKPPRSPFEGMGVDANSPRCRATGT